MNSKIKFEAMKIKRVCPYCKSDDVSLYASKNGFSAGKALVGGVLLGPVGLLAGAAGANKEHAKCMCNHCGQIFDPQYLVTVKEAETEEEKTSAEQFNKEQEENAKKTVKNALIGLGIFCLVVVVFVAIAMATGV